MNRKGGVLLRDVIFMIILFGGIMAIASLFVIDMADEYSNTNMTNEYMDDDVEGLGSAITSNITEDLDDMKDATGTTESSGGLLSAFDTFFEAVSGAGTVMRIVFTSPVYVSNAIRIMVTSLGVPTSIALILRNVMVFLLYAVIIFGIITALLRGGKV